MRRSAPALLALLALACAPQSQRELPRLGRLPGFRLTAVGLETRGPFTAADLAGRPWVADFIFTSCSGPCPVLSAHMAGLQERLPEAVRLVSFTVDPARDTPAVLRAYAARLGARPGRWLFATGSEGELRRLVTQGFRLAAAEEPGAPAGRRIAHSAKFVLVDAEGTLRGYYDGQDPADLRRLARDARTLLPKAS